MRQQDTSVLAQPRARLAHAAVECGAVSPRFGVYVDLWGSSPSGDFLLHGIISAVLTRAEQIIDEPPDRFKWGGGNLR